MIIDAHSHGMHGGYLDQLFAAGGDWMRKRVGRLQAKHQETPQYFDVALRVEQVDRHSIDLQMVTTSVTLDASLFPGDANARVALARAMNDNMARLMEDSKGKMVAAGCVPIVDLDRGGRQEMERAIKTLGLKAINLPSNINGKPLDAPEFEPFWDLAEEMAVAVYIHPLYQPGRSYEADYDLPHVLGWPFETAITLARLVFTGILERHPSLKIVSHHLGGGMVPFFMGRIVESYDPTSSSEPRGTDLPRPLFDYFSRFYYDTAAGGSAAAIKCAYDVFGADQIVFATDAPNGPKRGDARLETYPRVIESLGLPEGNKEKIFALNARRILALG